MKCYKHVSVNKKKIENVILEILCIAFIYAIFHKGTILLNFGNEKNGQAVVPIFFLRTLVPIL